MPHHADRNSNTVATLAAERLGVTTATIYKYITGQQYPTLPTLRRVEAKFGWSLVEQIRLIPDEPGDPSYGMVLEEVIREHFPDATGKPTIPLSRGSRRKPGTWTATYVATDMNVGVPSVTRWVSGTRYPEVRTMLRIERMYGWPAVEQITLVPIEGYDDRYGAAFRAVLDRHYAAK